MAYSYQLYGLKYASVEYRSTNGIVATCKIVSSIFLASNQLFWMEELAVCASAHLIDDRGLQVTHHTARHRLASTSLGEEGVECIVTTANCLVAGHLTIRLDAVLEAEKLPASIALHILKDSNTCCLQAVPKMYDSRMLHVLIMTSIVKS